MNKAMREAIYRQGFLDGLRNFTHWFNDREYVGVVGMTYEEASENVKKLSFYNPPITDDDVVEEE